MKRTFNGHKILQVTPGQCPACGARPVFSVLVTESGIAGSRTDRRIFLTCDRAPFTRRYSHHDCERDAAQEVIMTIATSARDYLAREGVQYEVISHERTGDSTHTAHAAHVPGDQMVKCVMLEDRHGYLMAVLPATHMVDLRAVRRQLNRKLSLAPEGEIAGLFKDCEPGAIPPLGAAYGLDAVLDERLIGSPDIYFEAGDHETLVHVTGNDFLRLMIGVRRGEISQHV